MSSERLGDQIAVRAQYVDPDNFNARVAIHARFSTNELSFPAWVFDRSLEGVHGLTLEVGGGPGNIWVSQRDRLSRSMRVIFTDYSTGMVLNARDRIDDDRFAYLATDAQHLPFEDLSFDLVLANHMLYHVPDIGRALSEIRRVLRADGRFVAATNGHDHMWQLRGLIGRPRASSSAFSLENGDAQLRAHFDTVTVERYPNHLDVTDTESVMAYIRSIADFWTADRGQEEIAAEVASVIEREGAFRIDTDAGLFVATRT